MATHDWMKFDHEPPARARRARAQAISATEDRRSTLEVLLAVAGFATWLWCAYEVLLTLAG